jgi:recombinase-like zinc beta ribbon protein
VTRKVRHVAEREMDDPDRVALPKACPPLVSRAMGARVQLRLAQNKAASAGRNPDPLETLWRGMALCGHCGRPIGTVAHTHGRRYACRANWNRNGASERPCAGGSFSVRARDFDAATWLDVREWLEKPENVAQLLDEWMRKEQRAKNSIASRLEAVEATSATLRDKMGRLADTIADTADPISRRVLQEKLDGYAAQLRAEEAKRERLMGEGSDGAGQEMDAQSIRAWVAHISERAPTMTRAEQVTALHALGARMTVWRKDYVHADGWPQRYKITLHWSGFTGQTVMLPARQSRNRDPNIL